VPDPHAIQRKVIGHGTGDNSNCVVCRPLSGRVGWGMQPKACGTVRSPCWMPDHCPRGPRFDPEAIPRRFKPIQGDPCPHDLPAGSRSLDIAGHGRIQRSELQAIQSGPGPRTHHIASAVLPSLVNPDSAILTGYQDHAGQSLPAFAVSWSHRRRSAPA
jgi:hypothetical protein